jgi:hypothetical protein
MRSVILVLLLGLVIPWLAESEVSSHVVASSNAANRDNVGTNLSRAKNPSLQDESLFGLTLADQSKAEGTGLEPATPCGAPHFQCGR